MEFKAILNRSETLCHCANKTSKQSAFYEQYITRVCIVFVRGVTCTYKIECIKKYKFAANRYLYFYVPTEYKHSFNKSCSP